MALLLFEDHRHFDLLPFTFTRPVFDLRVGIYTFLERWQALRQEPVAGLGYQYLQARYPLPLSPSALTWINGRYLPEPELLQMCKAIGPNEAYLAANGDVLLAHFTPTLLPQGHEGLLSADLLRELGLSVQQTAYTGLSIEYPEHIFYRNEEFLRFDFPLVWHHSPKTKLKDPHSRVYGADNLLIHPSATVKAAILNAEDGPIYLGPESTVQEGAIIHGAHAICAHARVNMGAKLRGDSTIGPYVKVGGEVANSVIMGYSNKGHEGYLGNSVIGHWCNLGADTNTSNLKNNYTAIRIWHYPSQRFRDTGMQFCGLLMGDHSKTGINTMLNTGTVVGVSTNIFGSGYPRNYIPSFSWGGPSGFNTYRLDKALETAALAMPRKGGHLDEVEKQILEKTFSLTEPYRRSK